MGKTMSIKQNKTVERSCSIVDVPLIVRIHHDHLDKDARVEDAHHSREKLFITITVTWDKETVRNFDDLFNYAALYHLIQSKHDSIIEQPIECLIDELDDELQYTAQKQNTRLIRTYIRIGRPDILHGHVRLEKTSQYD